MVQESRSSGTMADDIFQFDSHALQLNNLALNVSQMLACQPIHVAAGQARRVI